MTAEPAAPKRCDHCLEIPLGSVVHDTQEKPWVFVGWCINTKGRVAHFVKASEDSWLYVPTWEYHVTFLHTVLGKFPDIRKFITKEQE